MNIVDMKTEIAKQLGFNNYEYLMKNKKHINTPKYQKKFDSFYRIRRNADWRKVYYDYFLKNFDNKSITFRDIIYYLFDNLPKTKNGNEMVEASFSSKMLHTINPEMPILDNNVLKNMNLSIKGNTPEDKRENAIEVYKIICNRYKKFEKTTDYNDIEKLFDDSFPNFKNLSKAKKIDWFMYGVETKDLKNYGGFDILING